MVVRNRDGFHALIIDDGRLSQLGVQFFNLISDRPSEG